MSEAYPAVVIEHFRRPHNKGRIAGANATAEGANPLCGDRIRIDAQVDGARLIAVSFTGDACAICIAAASLLTTHARGKSVTEVMALRDEETFAWLEHDVPPARRRCATLPLDTLRLALTPFVAVSIVRPVLLAAGTGKRFGGDKMLALVDGEPLVRIAAAAYSSLCGRATIVVSDDPRLAEALKGLPVDIVVNAEYEEGIASSIRAGVGASSDRPAVMIALADEPRVDRALVMDVMRRWHEGRPPIVAPRYDGAVGHPVLFDRRCFADLLALEGDSGARPLIKAMAHEVLFVDVEGPRPLDVDTPDDLDRL